MVGRGGSNVLKSITRRPIFVRSNPQMKGEWNHGEEDELSEVGGWD